MARPISDEELQLKKRARRRLVGAIVLVTAVAVVLPMVLDSEPKPPSQNVDIQIPSPDSGEFKPKGAASGMSGAIKVPQGSASKSAAAASKPEAPPPPIAGLPPEPAPAPSVKAAAKAPEPKAAPADTKDTAKTAAKEPASPMAGAYVVQVAALADSGKAKQLEKQMADTGLKTYTEVVNTQSGEVTRVRAGPFATREAAEKARAQLKKAGMDGTVLPK